MRRWGVMRGALSPHEPSGSATNASLAVSPAWGSSAQSTLFFVGWLLVALLDRETATSTTYLLDSLSHTTLYTASQHRTAS